MQICYRSETASIGSLLLKICQHFQRPSAIILYAQFNIYQRGILLCMEILTKTSSSCSECLELLAYIMNALDASFYVESITDNSNCMC